MESELAVAVRPRRHRRALKIALAVLAAVLLVLVICEALGWRFLRGPIERQATDRLGVPVRLEPPFDLHLLRPPQVSLGGLHVDAAPGSAAPFLIEASDLRVRWNWSDLLALRRGEPLHLQTLEADTLQAHLIRPEQGVASWELPGLEKDAQAKSEPAELPSFGVLRLRDGSVAIDDALTDVKLEVTARVDEGASAQAGQAGGFALDAKGRYRKLPVEASLRAPAALPLLARGEAAPAVEVQARAAVGRSRYRFDGVLRDALGSHGIDGRISIEGTSLAAVGEPVGVVLPTTGPFALAGRISKPEEVWRAVVEKATIGDTRLAGEFEFDPRGARPALRGKLTGQRLALADLGPAVGGQPAPPEQDKDTKPEPPPKDGKVLPDREFDLPSLTAMDADVQVALDEFDLSTTAIEPLKPLRGHIRLKDGVLAIADIDARTAGGSVAGRTALDSTVQPARWETDLRLRGIDLAGWLSGTRKDEATVTARSSRAALRRERREARSGDAPVEAYITGELQAGLKLTARGNSTAALLGSLDGTARATVRDGTLSHLAIEAIGLDIAQALGVFVSGDASLPLNCAVVDLQAQSGVLTPQVAVFDTRDSSLWLDGTIDLKREQLDLRGIVKPKDFTLISLRSPVHVQGSFGAPAVSVEAAPIAGRLLAGAALSLVNPAAALLAFMDTGDAEGASAGCRDLAQTAQAEKARSTGKPAPARAAPESANR